MNEFEFELVGLGDGLVSRTGVDASSPRWERWKAAVSACMAEAGVDPSAWWWEWLPDMECWCVTTWYGDVVQDVVGRAYRLCRPLLPVETA